MRLVLFDVDGTLMLSGGAGMRAFATAMNQVFGIAVLPDAVSPDGKTDPLIVREVLAYLGQEDRLNEQTRDAVFAAYLSYLREEMDKAEAEGRIQVLSGVTTILDALLAQPDFAVGLVTGNLEEGARIKLERARLDGYFSFGGYGSDSEDRTAVIHEGMRRGARHISPARVESSFVIGDTPLDIIHGHQAGACVIAVASSRYTLADLRPYNPDLLVRDLTPADQIISFMRTWPS
jgi:phosphoglycolate phosphatase